MQDGALLQGLCLACFAFVPLSPSSLGPLSLLSDHRLLPLWLWEKLVLPWSGISLTLCKVL